MSQCRCPSPNKTVTIVACLPTCPTKAANKITYYLAVTVVADADGEIRQDKSGEYYVYNQGSTDSLHSMDVLDVLGAELNSDDGDGTRGALRDQLWHIKSVKKVRGERIGAINEDDGDSAS